MALLALSRRQTWFKLKTSCLLISVDFTMFPRYLYSFNSSIFSLLKNWFPEYSLPNTITFVLVSLTINLLLFWSPFSVFENNIRSSAYSSCTIINRELRHCIMNYKKWLQWLHNPVDGKHRRCRYISMTSFSKPSACRKLTNQFQWVSNSFSIVYATENFAI